MAIDKSNRQNKAIDKMKSDIEQNEIGVAKQAWL